MGQADAAPGMSETARPDPPGSTDSPARLAAPDLVRPQEAPAPAAPARSIRASNAREAACLAAIFLLAAADRLVNLPGRGIWDSDQGTEMGAIWNAVVTRQLPTFGSRPTASGARSTTGLSSTTS